MEAGSSVDVLDAVEQPAATVTSARLLFTPASQCLIIMSSVGASEGDYRRSGLNKTAIKNKLLTDAQVLQNSCSVYVVTLLDIIHEKISFKLGVQ